MFEQHPMQPTWFSLPSPQAASIPPDLKIWLTDTGSLTQRLQQHCCAHSHLQVRDRLQYWTRPWQDEVQCLGLSQRHYALLRQVQLCCDDTCLVFARTVLPQKLLKKHRRLAHLGNMPLGHFLFMSASGRRLKMEMAQLHTGHALFAQAIQHLAIPPKHLWARRSVFSLSGQRLLVQEVFLPSM